MKAIITLLVCLFFSFSLAAGDIHIRDVQLKKEGDSVLVSFTVHVDKWDKKSKLRMTPVLYAGASQVVLEPLFIVGKLKDVSERRNGVYYTGKKVIRKPSDHLIIYRRQVVYESWMSEVSLGVDQVFEACCEAEEVSRQVVVADRLIYYPLIPEFRMKSLPYTFTELEQFTLDNPFLHPSEEYDKRYELFTKDKEKESLQVYFRQGTSTIQIEYGRNREVLDAVTRAFDLINKTENARLQKVMIAGFASPEGSDEMNYRLAERRARSVKDFIKSRMSRYYNDELFEFYNGGKDWDGLVKLMEKNRHISGMDQAIDIVRRYNHVPECNELLKRINNGTTYRYLLNNLYPQLRNAGFVQVYYEIERRAGMATLITNEEGRTTWIDPDSPDNRVITRINEAISLMKEGRYDEAVTLMYPVSHDPRTFNYIGVCHMMVKQYDEAEKWFMKAISHRDPYAQVNLDRTQKVRTLTN